MFQITMYAAGNGDAFLIEDDRTSILIDCGYVSTLTDELLPDLRTRAAKGRAVDLLVSTHIDADHISGVVKLLEVNGSSNRPKVIPIDHVWHNSLSSLSLPSQPGLTLSQGDNEILQHIRHRGLARSSSPPVGQEDISALQGSSLASLLRSGAFRWNFGHGTQAIASPLDLVLNGRTRVNVIGPSPQRLLELRDWWIRTLRGCGFSSDLASSPMIEDAFEFLCSYETGRAHHLSDEISRATGDRTLADVYKPDTSVTNGSSISLIIESNGRRLLFLGDAWAEDIAAALSLDPTAPTPTNFDVIKVSHHGSSHNTSPALLNLIDSPRYLISSNGYRHNHPDIEVLRAIVDRPASQCRELFFNFSTPASRSLRTYRSKSNAPFVIHENAHVIDLSH